MYIKELAQRTFLSPETIRMYRNMGFLHPKKLSNGYYDYTMEDYAALIYLRKLRELSFSLQDIRNFETEENDQEDILTERQKQLDEEIFLLKEKLYNIELEKQHIEESRHIRAKAVIMPSIDEKIDLYGPTDAFASLMPAYYLSTTTCLFVSRDILNGPVEDKVIPLKTGLGTYRYMLEYRHMAIPEEAVIVPNGLQISQMISLRNLDEIHISDLAPMMNLAKEKHVSFLSDTTAYLARIREVNGERIFDFRIRACIQITERDPHVFDRFQ